MSHKATMSASALRTIMGESFDFDKFEQGRKDCRDLAKKLSYDEFAEKLEEVRQRIEYASFRGTPGPSYWIGCLCEFDFVAWPKKEEVQNDE